MPKSVTTARSSPECASPACRGTSRTLLLLKSRWTTPSAWAARARTHLADQRQRLGGAHPSAMLRRRWASVPPSRSSMVRKWTATPSAVRRRELEDVTDVRVAHAAGEQHLPPEALERRRSPPAGRCGWSSGRRGSGAESSRLVDRPHAAAGDEADDGEAAGGLLADVQTRQSALGGLRRWRGFRGTRDGACRLSNAARPCGRRKSLGRRTTVRSSRRAVAGVRREVPPGAGASSRSPTGCKRTAASGLPQGSRKAVQCEPTHQGTSGYTEHLRGTALVASASLQDRGDSGLACSASPSWRSARRTS